MADGRRGPRSAEHRAKISAALRGKAPSAQTLAAARAATLGKPLSAEHRAKLSAALKGRPSARKGRTFKPLSAETRAKMSAAHSKPRGPYAPERMAKLHAAIRKAAALRRERRLNQPVAGDLR